MAYYMFTGAGVMPQREITVICQSVLFFKICITFGLFKQTLGKNRMFLCSMLNLHGVCHFIIKYSLCVLFHHKLPEHLQCSLASNRTNCVSHAPPLQLWLGKVLTYSFQLIINFFPIDINTNVTAIATSN